MTEIVLGPSLSQTDPRLRPGGPSSVNDCWVVAGDQAARASGGRYTKAGSVVIDGMSIATVIAFRGFAHKPDKPGEAGAGNLEDIERGINGAYPTLRTYVTRNFDTFVAKARAGGSFVLIIDCSKLPDSVERYGFNGIHAISGRDIVQGKGETWYHINPLQPIGTNAKQITLGAIKRAFLGAVLVKPPVEVVPPPIEGGPVDPPKPPATPPITQQDLNVAYAKGYNEGLDAATKAVASVPRKVAQ